MASPPAAKPNAATLPAAAITLAAPNTDAGAMERLFLLEAYSPGNVGNYVAADNLTAMRLMRQTIENRLISPAEYGARGATTETGIVELGNQFAGFGSYPTLDAGMSANLTAILQSPTTRVTHSKPTTHSLSETPSPRPPKPLFPQQRNTPT